MLCLFCLVGLVPSWQFGSARDAGLGAAHPFLSSIGALMKRSRSEDSSKEKQNGSFKSNKAVKARETATSREGKAGEQKAGTHFLILSSPCTCSVANYSFNDSIALISFVFSSIADSFPLKLPFVFPFFSSLFSSDSLRLSPSYRPETR